MLDKMTATTCVFLLNRKYKCKCISTHVLNSKVCSVHLQCWITFLFKAEQSDNEAVQNRAWQSIAAMQCIRVIRAPSRVNDGRLARLDDTLCRDNISRASHCSHFDQDFLSPGKSVVLWWEWNPSWASMSIRGWNNYCCKCVLLAAIKVCRCYALTWRYDCYCWGFANTISYGNDI